MVYCGVRYPSRTRDNNAYSVGEKMTKEVWDKRLLQKVLRRMRTLEDKISEYEQTNKQDHDNFLKRLRESVDERLKPEPE
jgi:uridine kinase